MCPAHTEHLLRTSPWTGSDGDTKMSQRVDLPSAVFLSSTHTPSHYKNTGAKTGGDNSLGRVHHKTHQDSLTLPELLTISLLCPPSTTRSSEDNIKFEICQLAEPST